MFHQEIQKQNPASNKGNRETGFIDPSIAISSFRELIEQVGHCLTDPFSDLLTNQETKYHLNTGYYIKLSRYSRLVKGFL
jgi:hypothetical protein